MKKKALMAILSLCVAMAMTACGGNADTAEVKETTKVEETTETEEDMQAEIEGETETSPEAEGVVESEQTEEEATGTEESFEEIEIGADGLVNGQEFPILSDEALSQDKREEYGVNSISCYDLDQYLTEEGMLSEEIVSEEKLSSEYSGRWAYPEITPCRFFGEMTMTSRTDAECSYSSVDSETGIKIVTGISSGKDEYYTWESMMNMTLEGSDTQYEKMFTMQTTGGETEVIHAHWEITMSASEEENSEETTEDSMHIIDYYYFTIGNFTVSVLTDSGAALTQEDIQLIADNIRLTNGMER